MSLFDFRNGKKSLIRVRAIKGFFKVLANKRDKKIEAERKLNNKMSIKYSIRGEKE